MEERLEVTAAHASMRVYAHPDNSDHVPSDLRAFPSAHQRICRNYVEREEITNSIRREFLTRERVNGAVFSHVILWGPRGSGKRQLAINFANEFAAADNRKILWLEPFSPATFVRDYFLAYRLITGSNLPAGAPLHCTLSKIERTLSERCHEWLMVILDFDEVLDKLANMEMGTTLTKYLPFGQILITHSCPPARDVIRDVDVSRLKHPSSMCPVIFEAATAHIYVGDFTPQQSLKFIQQTGLTKTLLDHGPSRHLNIFACPPLELVVACAASRLSNCSLTRLASLTHKRIRRISRIGKSVDDPTAHHYAVRLNHLISTLLHCIQNTSRRVELLVHAMVILGGADVWLDLIKLIPHYKTDPIGLMDDIEVLQNLGIVDLKTLEDGSKYMTIHKSIHELLGEEYGRSHWSRNPFFRYVIQDWTRHMEEHLPEIMNQKDADKYWILLHTFTLLLPKPKDCYLGTSSLLSLWRKVSSFCIDTQAMNIWAQRILAHAQSLCSDLRIFDDPGPLNVEEVMIHREKSRLHMRINDFFHADIAMQAAKRCLATLEGPTKVRRSMALYVMNEDVHQLLRRDFMADAREIATLMLQRSVSHDTMYYTADLKYFTAKLHYWMACSTDVESNVWADSIQHSHMAMAYWLTLPEDVRWGKTDLAMLDWVDKHVSLLTKMSKGKGALAFLPRLLDRYLEEFASTNEKIWRIAYANVREYSFLEKYEEAEAVVCKVLSLYPVDALPVVPLTWVISMVCYLGYGKYQRGQFVEAECMVKWCVRMQLKEETPLPDSRAGQRFSQIWADLFRCLLIQGKNEEVNIARRTAQAKGFEVDEWNDLGEATTAYGRAMQAARDRRAGVYNEDDAMLNIYQRESFASEISMLGDPFDRIDFGNEDFENDIQVGQINVRRANKILTLLGFEYVPRPMTTPRDFTENESYSNYILGGRWVGYVKVKQKFLWDYWKWCHCRRFRQRSSRIRPWSVVEDRTAHLEEVAEKSAPIRELRQTQILDYFPRLPRYSTDACSENCPCIGAAKRGALLTEELERTRLWLCDAPSGTARDAQEALLQGQLVRHRSKYGRRPAIPYGMDFLPRIMSRSERSKPKERRVHPYDHIWIPGCYNDGDEPTTGMPVDQEENYILNNPALEAVFGEPVYRTPLIVISALGEEIPRMNVDKWVGTRFEHKIWWQRPLRRYFKKVPRSKSTPNSPDAASSGRSSSLSIIFPEGPSKKKKRIGRSARFRGGSNAELLLVHRSSSNTSSSTDSRSRSRSPKETLTDRNDDPSKKRKLRIWQLESLTENNPIFKDGNARPENDHGDSVNPDSRKGSFDDDTTEVHSEQQDRGRVRVTKQSSPDQPTQQVQLDLDKTTTQTDLTNSQDKNLPTDDNSSAGHIEEFGDASLTYGDQLEDTNGTDLPPQESGAIPTTSPTEQARGRMSCEEKEEAGQEQEEEGSEDGLSESIDVVASSTPRDESAVDELPTIVEGTIEDSHPSEWKGKGRAIDW